MTENESSSDAPKDTESKPISDLKETPPPDPAESETEQHTTDKLASNRRVLVECSNLTKSFRRLFSFRETTALDGLDLQIFQGEVFGLLGPNGSGKTTTMKLLLGLLFPDEGDARVLQRDPTDVSTKERIGFLPEQSHLYDFLTGKETLEFYGNLFGMSNQQRAEKVDELLKAVGLWEERNRPLSAYSKGMTRRIGFAQALINDPDIVFLDEPTVGLDPIIARQLKDYILELRDEGKTLIVSSHVLADVQDVCDRVAILHDGVKRKEGEVDELLEVKEELEVIVDATGDSEESREEIRELLLDYGWKTKGFSHPTRTLENLFLSTIEASEQES